MAPFFGFCNRKAGNEAIMSSSFVIKLDTGIPLTEVCGRFYSR